MEHKKKLFTLSFLLLSGFYLLSEYNQRRYVLLNNQETFVDTNVSNSLVDNDTSNSLNIDSLIRGEISYDVPFTLATKNEFVQGFISSYNSYNGSSPKTGDVTVDELINYTLDYTGKKLRFRHSVLFPGRLAGIVRKFPMGEALLPSQKQPSFQKTSYIDLVNTSDERVTDCWDYSQLFKEGFNVLAEIYCVDASCKRVRGDVTYSFLGLSFTRDTHDFNQVISDGKITYIDPNGVDSWWVKNPADITSRVD